MPLFIHVLFMFNSPISVRVISLALGKLHDFLRAKLLTPIDMGKIVHALRHWNTRKCKPLLWLIYIYIFLNWQLVVKYSESTDVGQAFCGITVSNFTDSLLMGLMARRDFRFDGDTTRTLTVYKRDVINGAIAYQVEVATLTVRSQLKFGRLMCTQQ